MIHPSVSAAQQSATSRTLNACLIRSTVVAGIAGLLFGFDTAVIAGTTQALTNLYHLSPASLGLTVAIALWGTIAGSCAASLPGDHYGRRDSLRSLAVLFFVSAIGCALAWNWSSFVAFRFVAGLAIGGSSVLGPMYIAEIAPAQWRGRLVGFFQLSIVFGILTAYFSNYVIGGLALGAVEWRWKLGVSALPAMVLFFALFLIPRSPRWLAQKGRISEARGVLTIMGETDIDAELRDIVASIGGERSAIRERLFSKKYRVPVFLAVTVALFNQLAGINSILYYLNDIFQSAGFNKLSGDLQAVGIGATNFVFTIAAMSVIDKVGRKTLLLIGSVGTCVCLATVCVMFVTGKYQELLIWPLIGYVASFAFSQGAVIWVYISEVFPNRVRATGQSLGSLIHWVATALLSGIFPMLSAHSPALPFAFFSAMMALQFFVVFFLFPETKGITLEEMQHKLGIA